MTVFDILQSIEDASGKNDKRQILEDNKDNKKLGELLDASLNFFRKFHVVKFDILKAQSLLSDDHAHVELMNILNELESRQVTGSSAVARVESFLELCTPEQQDWYSRVIRKDLKIGVSVDTATKYFNIPTFDVMLATDGKKCKKMNEIISKGVYASPKLDGYRCLAVITNSSVSLYSRNGSVYTNFPTIEASLLETFGDQDVVFDGEIMSDDFQAMQQSAFANKRGTTVGDVKYHIFDVLSINEWNTSQFLEKKSSRQERLNNLALNFDSNLVLVKQELVNTVDKVLELEQQYMALGYEGVMIVPDVPYYKGRKSNRLMKFKTMLSQDCEIIGFYEGTAGTRNEGRLGGLVLKQENGLICECGSGFSDEDRDYIWRNKSQFINKLCEVKYQELTNHDIMRFPVFTRFRNDK